SFGLFSRMLLLRWRRGNRIALILAALTTLAALLGMWFEEVNYGRYRGEMNFDWSGRWVALAITFFSVAIGVLASWPAWVACVKLFLPPRTAKQLLDWQRELSEPSALAR